MNSNDWINNMEFSFGFSFSFTCTNILNSLSLNPLSTWFRTNLFSSSLSISGGFLDWPNIFGLVFSLIIFVTTVFLIMARMIIIIIIIITNLDYFLPLFVIIFGFQKVVDKSL